jgi:RNA-directed DNA polymerase
VVQSAAKLILEPVFEADVKDCSDGYRPGRRAEDALQQIARNLREGYCEVYDADLQAYFDTIPHDKVLQCVERRVADRSVLRLLRLWLTAVVEARDDGGRRTRSRPTQGTPQGGVISPLFANLYLHWFDVVFHRERGPGIWANARLVRYADDFVIMARFIDHRIRRWVEQPVEEWLGLRINRTKTRVITLRPNSGATLDFLGDTFRYAWDRFGRSTRYLTAEPSTKAITRYKARVRGLTQATQCFVPPRVLVQQINTSHRGWQAYFSVGRPRRAYRVLNALTLARRTIHLRRRSQRACRPPAGMTYYSFIPARLGLQLL